MKISRFCPALVLRVFLNNKRLDLRQGTLFDLEPDKEL